MCLVRQVDQTQNICLRHRRLKEKRFFPKNAFWDMPTKLLLPTLKILVWEMPRSRLLEFGRENVIGLTTETGISLVGKRYFLGRRTRFVQNICVEVYMKTENSDREWFYLHPPVPENALKCFVTSCVLSITFSLINLLTKTEKDTKASLNLHTDTGYTESAITT